MGAYDFHAAMQSLITPTSNFKIGVSGRFCYRDAAPASWSQPYATWFTVYCNIRDTQTANVEDRMIQVDIYDATLEGCMQLADYADALFHRAKLVGASILTQCLVRRAKTGPEKTDDNEWVIHLEYSVIVQNT